ncbi:hypothetical protein ACQPXB_22745 [Amycolatopsis sp. CA-161197]|uniref:hypothetical protein n=1 Tax=Amycolatopsis sp. CA-161197 TaxID=3239922 RepID=UPI003D9446E3
MKVRSPARSLHVVTVSTEGATVTSEIVETFNVLQELLADHDEQAGPLRVALVTTQSGSHAGQNALVEAMRGIAQSLARELGARIRINSVVCDAESEMDLQPTLDFLAGSGSGYVTGATIDLRRPR